MNIPKAIWNRGNEGSSVLSQVTRCVPPFSAFPFLLVQYEQELEQEELEAFIVVP
jgi:hypothetical protein